jgi:hypothetical protein
MLLEVCMQLSSRKVMSRLCLHLLDELLFSVVVVQSVTNREMIRDIEREVDLRHVRRQTRQNINAQRTTGKRLKAISSV